MGVRPVAETGPAAVETAASAPLVSPRTAALLSSLASATSPFASFRARYPLTYSPTGVRRDDGWHEIAVTLKGRSGKVKVRPGYFAAAPSSAGSRRQPR